MKTQNAHGNVLFFILLGVALFAALSYTVSNSFRGGGSTITDEQARVSAGRLIRSMQDIKTGHDYLWNQQGCSIGDIDFTNPATTPFDCDIFHPQGAGISYPNDLAKYQSGTGSGVFTFYPATSAPTGGYGVDGLGTTASDYMVLLLDVKPEICINVNKLIGYANPYDDIIDAAGTVANADIMGNVANVFDAQTTGCRARAAGGPYDVWHVIQAL